MEETAAALALSGASSSVVAGVVEQLPWATYALSANRISHHLALIGSSVAVDTASSSSLVAAHLAVGDATRLNVGARALACGVNLILHPNLTRMHTLRKLFPADGRCKTFDAAADGFERGEAAEAIALRPLVEAQLGGDSVLAVVCGSAVIHKGGGASLRAMRGPAIVMKVAAALKDARMAPSGLGYMEASGLGEPFGDALEVRARVKNVARALIPCTDLQSPISAPSASPP